MKAVSLPPPRRLWHYLVITQRPLAIVLHLLHQLITGRLREDGEPVDIRTRLGRGKTELLVSLPQPLTKPQGNSLSVPEEGGLSGYWLD